jgi:hypothetical protein
VSDEAYARYVRINLPHSRTIVQRISRNLELLGAFREGENGGRSSWRAAASAWSTRSATTMMTRPSRARSTKLIASPDWPARSWRRF